MNNDNYLTLEQVATKLQLNYWTVLDHVNNGVLPGVRIGARWRVSEAALEQFLKERTTHG